MWCMTCGAKEDPKGITTHNKNCVYPNGHKTKSPLSDQDNIQMEIVEDKQDEREQAA